mmetsp:Transcript_19595/g.52679  ORF Transcript_19595/g.52679 Transcript_19595/m.52679 type:complete len:206 (-) Transcript_19595:858-1475(-)
MHLHLLVCVIVRQHPTNGQVHWLLLAVVRAAELGGDLSEAFDDDNFEVGNGPSHVLCPCLCALALRRGIQEQHHLRHRDAHRPALPSPAPRRLLQHGPPCVGADLAHVATERCLEGRHARLALAPTDDQHGPRRDLAAVLLEEPPRELDRRAEVEKLLVAKVLGEFLHAINVRQVLLTNEQDLFLRVLLSGDGHTEIVACWGASL